MQRCVMRHPKQQTLGDVQVLELPPRTQAVQLLDLTDCEGELYAALEQVTA